MEICTGVRWTFGSAGRATRRHGQAQGSRVDAAPPTRIDVVETAYADSGLTVGNVRRLPLIWAAIFSLTVHSVLVAMPLLERGRGSHRSAESTTSWLQATLVSPSDTVGGVEAMVVPEPLQHAEDFVLPTAPPAPVTAPNVPAPPAAADGGMQGTLLVEAQPLQDRDRLGELLTRQLNEFPVELEFPVRLREKIIARYPPAALAAGRAGSVAVWVVVDAQGRADEILVTDGAEEFANEVIAAIRNAHFLPAQNNMLPISFPISLEFQFSAAKPAETAPAADRK